MRAWKFLAPGGVGRFSGRTWPAPEAGRPGAWMEAAGGALACRSGVHACRAGDLPWWLGPELWEVELDGAISAYAHKVAAPRGRLVRRVESWTPTTQRAYVEACAWRAHDRALQTLVGPAADRLAACMSLPDVEATARALASDGAPDRIALVMAADAATTVASGLAAMGAYVAAHAARHAAGAAAMDAERRWQADWLDRRLALSAAHA